MKDIREIKQREKTVCPTVVAEFTYSSTYKASDFLNSFGVAKRYGIPEKTAREIIHELQNKKQCMVVNGHKKPVIIKLKGKHGPFLHPLAISIFEQCLQKTKE